VLCEEPATTPPSDFGLHGKQVRIGGGEIELDNVALEKAQAVLRVCISKDGAVTSIALTKGTGDPERDRHILDSVKEA
jgi:hypothetical protein